MPDAPIHASRLNAQKHLVVFDLGTVDVPEFKDIEARADHAYVLVTRESFGLL